MSLEKHVEELYPRKCHFGLRRIKWPCVLAFRLRLMRPTFECLGRIGQVVGGIFDVIRINNLRDVSVVDASRSG